MRQGWRSGARVTILAGVVAVTATLTEAAVVREQRFVEQLIAAGSDGAPVGEELSSQVASADGRFVAFVSRAANLVPGDANGQFDVFVRDRWKGTTELVSVAANGGGADGSSFSPSISADGRFVAFSSLATNLASGDNNRQFDVFVRDRQLGVNQVMSVSEDGTEADGSSGSPAISADGRFVAFASAATNLVPFDINGKQDIFLRDRRTRAIQRVSLSSGGEPADGASFQPSLSRDGNRVAFASDATNLVAGDSNQAPDIFVRDRASRTTIGVSTAPSGALADGGSDRPAISGDGGVVAFQSDATDLVPGDTNGTTDVFVRDLGLNVTERLAVLADGSPANGPSTLPAISADGRRVVFQSLARNLDPNDTNRGEDIYLWERASGGSGVVTRLSVDANGLQGEGPSFSPQISGDGRVVTYTSDAFNLVTRDTNTQREIFVSLARALPSVRVAVFRPGTREWFVRGDAGEGAPIDVPFVRPGDQPVPADYLGTGHAQLAIYRASTRQWFVRFGPGEEVPVRVGDPPAIPVPGDYLGTGQAQIAVFRPSTREWLVLAPDGEALLFPLGQPGDVPVPADYLGAGRDQFALYRPSTQEWLLRGVERPFTIDLVPGDGVPVPARYEGSGHTQMAVFLPSTAEWFIRHDSGATQVAQWGQPGDIPVPGDYLGLGRAQLAVYHPPSGQWFIQNEDGTAAVFQFGIPGDLPVPAAY